MQDVLFWKLLCSQNAFQLWPVGLNRNVMIQHTSQTSSFRGVIKWGGLLVALDERWGYAVIRILLFGDINVSCKHPSSSCLDKSVRPPQRTLFKWRISFRFYALVSQVIRFTALMLEHQHHYAESILCTLHKWQLSSIYSLSPDLYRNHLIHQ